MRRIFGGAAAVLLAATTFALASPAYADTVTIDYEVTAEDPMTHAWPDATCYFPWAGSPQRAVIAEATVTVSGAYNFTDLYPSTGLDDAEFQVLLGDYQPSDVTNCLATVSGTTPITLTAGQTYTLVLSSEAGDGIGTYSFTATGPGILQVDLPVPATPEPPAQDPTPPSQVATASK